MNSDDMLELVRSTMTLICCFECLLFFCYFGQRVTSAFSSLSEFIYTLDWQSFPIGMQKYISLIMQYSQKPVYIRGLGSIHCTLEVFQKVTPSDDFDLVFNSLTYFCFIHLQIINKAYEFFAVFKRF